MRSRRCDLRTAPSSLSTKSHLCEPHPFGDDHAGNADDGDGDGELEAGDVGNMASASTSTWRPSRSRGIDERLPAGHRGYIAAWGQIQSALDNLQALRHLLATLGATPYAPWTLLRAVFEGGFWGVWLLEPADTLERRRRGLRLELRNHKQWNSFLAAYDAVGPAGITDAGRDNEAVYRAEASELGLSWRQATRRINLVDELRELTMVQDLPQPLRGPLEGVWRALSGLQHGDPYARLSTGDHADLAPITGGLMTTTSINDEAYNEHAWASTWMLLEAMRLYVERSGPAGVPRPWPGASPGARAQGHRHRQSSSA